CGTLLAKRSPWSDCCLGATAAGFTGAGAAAGGEEGGGATAATCGGFDGAGDDSMVIAGRGGVGGPAPGSAILVDVRGGGVRSPSFASSCAVRAAASISALAWRIRSASCSLIPAMSVLRSAVIG